MMKNKFSYLPYYTDSFSYGYRGKVDDKQEDRFA
jgi:hypothetical protein